MPHSERDPSGGDAAPDIALLVEGGRGKGNNPIAQASGVGRVLWFAHGRPMKNPSQSHRLIVIAVRDPDGITDGERMDPGAEPTVWGARRAKSLRERGER